MKIAPLSAMAPDGKMFLQSALPEEELRQLRGHARTGRPLGDDTFLAGLEDIFGRILKPQKRGPKPKQDRN